MKHELKEEVLRLGGDPSAEEWSWFLTRGPHGPDFTWSQTKNEPPGYVGIDHLERVVIERIESDSNFISKIRTIVDLSLNTKYENILRRALQVAAVVGDEEILKKVQSFSGSSNQKVAGDAKASIFVLKRRVRSCQA